MREVEHTPEDGRAGGVAGDGARTGSPRFGGLLAKVPAEIRDVSFSMAVRGYHRGEVDAYVELVNRAIAELEMSASPQSAVKHALDRVGEQTSGVLQRAREVAEELTATALAESEHATRRAKVESEEIVEQARAEAERVRAEALREAEEILARAREQAHESTRQAQARVDSLQREGERRLGTLREEIRDAAGARRQALEQVRRTAAELASVAAERAGVAADDGDSGAPRRDAAPAARATRPGAGPERERTDAASGAAAGQPRGAMPDAREHSEQATEPLQVPAKRAERPRPKTPRRAPTGDPARSR